MLRLEIMGKEKIVNELNPQVIRLAASDIRQYQHRGAGGDAGVFGLMTTIAVTVIPKLVDLLKPFTARDRNLKISINGFEIVVRDIQEATDVLDLLGERGLLKKDGNVAG
ncbi:MAG: hypothetical protein ABI380_11230 [Edaphobacter sp.]